MSTGEMSRDTLIVALNRAMRDASGQGVLYSQAVAERLGINSTDLECLDFIVLRGPISAGELAEAIGITTGAITGVIDRLERTGFARRDRHGSDRRKVLVRALPAVDRRIGPLFQPMERGAMSVLSQFSDKELAFLLDVFSRLGEAATKAITELNARPKSTRKPRSRK
jgi:DNA-binding MarR family transcriptional regulator